MIIKPEVRRSRRLTAEAKSQYAFEGWEYVPSYCKLFYTQIPVEESRPGKDKNSDRLRGRAGARVGSMK